MKRIILLSLGVLIAAVPLFAQDSPKKVVFIILDGIAYDVIKQVEIPNIDRISDAGGFSRAYVGGEKGSYSQTPTISAVGYNSLLTGTWVNKHNVHGNNIRRPNYNYWTIFRYLREARPEAKLAVFSSWLDNRTKLVGEGLEATGGLKIDYAFDGFELDSIAFPHDSKKQYISDIDEHVSQEAARYIHDNGPDLSWVYLEFPDDMGHQYGDSPQLFDAVKEADRQTGLIYDAVLSRIRMGEDWLIIVTTDHGREPETGLHHGGQSERERDIWISTNSPHLNAYFHLQTVAITDILPTLIRHLEIPVPEQNLQEVDGVPLIGLVSVYHPEVKRNNQNIVFSWEFMGEDDDEIEIWASASNKFRTTGKADRYKLLATVKGNKKNWSVSALKFKAPQMKVVFKGKHNTVNKWLVMPKNNE